MKAEAALGIDFGGTSVKIGLVDRRGRILQEEHCATSACAALPQWLAMVGRRVAAARAAGHRLRGIGVGVPGFTDFTRGYIYNLTNVPGWRGVPLAAIMRRKFSLPVCVDNDVNAMAYGEYLCGAGRGLRHAFFATLGTGVGGALVIDGKLYRGAFSMAGEIGHVPIRMNGVRTAEGRGGLEAYVGSRKIAAYAARAMRRGRKSLMAAMVRNNLGAITPRIIAAAARRGDRLALEVMDYTADCLAAAFAAVTYLVQPEAIIVGGGVAGSGRLLFAPLRRRLAGRLHKIFAERIRIIPAALGNRAGVIGCAMLALRPGAGRT